MGSDDRVDERERADIEQRLHDGEWLKVGDLMTLFANPNGKPASRSSVDRWITKGVRFGRKRLVIRYQIDPSGERLCHPEDVEAVLSESRKIRSADHPDGIPE
ncbi:hypothetical protein E1211_29750 [Micromonospora sp. 15K316]|uniref:hypothetical protein n=1 Tax=Micromonospora sp. 15K316 TaxID=2530376 RepID=UPI00104B3501|nr:hypothetical protein [Micromonospora sp. 15K316]TDC26883.1 hypothetical protein E1211_29750 [Micromonospora sp. 15K316]